MEWLKIYFSAGYRMNRKIYIVVAILYFTVLLTSSILVLSSDNFTENDKAIQEVANQKIKKTINEEQYKAKMNEIQLQVESKVSPLASVLAIAIMLLYLPAVAMRLKDLNYSPLLALLLLILPLITLTSRFTGMLMPIPFTMGLAIASLGMQLLLTMLPGTAGANRYGADPIKKSDMETE